MEPPSSPPGPPPPPPLAAVLAGGTGSRLGGAKAGVTLAGRPLISYPLAAAAGAGLEAVVVAKAESDLPTIGDVRTVVEPNEPRHPLTGVVTALRDAGARRVLVLPCDTPFLSPMLIRVLASATKPTAVRSEGRANPLIALYPPECLADLEAALGRRDPAKEALASLEPEWVEASATETFNVNTPEDLAEAERRLRQPRS